VETDHRVSVEALGRTPGRNWYTAGKIPHRLANFPVASDAVMACTVLFGSTVCDEFLPLFLQGCYSFAEACADR
jgi:hypothetical protein